MIQVRCYLLIAILMLPFGPALLIAQETAPIVFSEDGGWCWFEDPRAIIFEHRLIIGIVSSGYLEPSRRGDIRAIVYDLQEDSLREVELHNQLQLDDHDSPVFLALPDGRLAAFWSQHGDENRFYFSFSRSEDLTVWEEPRFFTPSEDSRITYSNPFRLPAESGRIYNFYRGLRNSFKPSYAFSDNLGRDWTSGSVFIDVPSEFRHRPYVRYTSDGEDTIHMVFTEGHPRNYNNSVYHVFYRNGFLHQSDGTVIASLADGLERPELGTRIFQGNPAQVAWTVDIEIDEERRPFTLFSIQVDSGGVPEGEEGQDHRYRLARWTGAQWEEEQIAFAGSRLYPGEDDYTGLGALYPGFPDLVYISANVDPSNGKPLISRKDGQRHYEIFEGVHSSSGWTWTPITGDSDVDNLRPVIPQPENDRTHLLWLRGSYHSYTDYSQQVVGIPLKYPGPLSEEDSGTIQGGAP